MDATAQQGFNIDDLETVEREVTVLVAEIAEMEEADVWAQKEANFFKDLEMDSLLALEILAKLEKQYKIEVPEERLPEITTLTKTVALVRSLC